MTLFRSLALIPTDTNLMITQHNQDLNMILESRNRSDRSLTQ
jgi:hypothetical protein